MKRWVFWFIIVASVFVGIWYGYQKGTVFIILGLLGGVWFGFTLGYAGTCLMPDIKE